MIRFILIFGLMTVVLPAIGQRPTWPSGLDSATRTFYDLTYSLIEKFNEGKLEEVKADIKTLNTLLPNYTSDWNYTNALHKINITEGRLALKTGDQTKAAEYLIEAGEAIIHNPSPNLKTFGPNMSLAKELLESGEQEAVLKYFKLCKKIWSGPIAIWENDISNGKIPDFKANLFY